MQKRSWLDLTTRSFAVGSVVDLGGLLRTSSASRMEILLARLQHLWPYPNQAAFYAKRFRAPAVPQPAALTEWIKELSEHQPEHEARAFVVNEVEAAGNLMTTRAEAVILADSFVFSAAVVLLAGGRGASGLIVTAAICSFASLWFSLFAELLHVGRTILGLSAGSDENFDVNEMAWRLARKAALSADGIVLLFPAAATLLLGALITS
jgi:hypothetical protein